MVMRLLVCDYVCLRRKRQMQGSLKLVECCVGLVVRVDVVVGSVVGDVCPCSDARWHVSECLIMDRRNG